MQLDKPAVICVAGASATGKTTFAQAAARSLSLPLVCKDEIKQILWNEEQYKLDPLSANRENGMHAYEILFYVAEQIMKAQVPFMLESNFRRQAEERLNALTDRYAYRVVTVRFDADTAILHERFLRRDRTAGRHPGLKVEGHYEDIRVFENAICEDRTFRVGRLISVDASDFDQVDYADILHEIQATIA